MSLRTPNEPTDDFRLPAKSPAAAPQPKPDVWRKTDTPGIEINQDGKRRTDLPKPGALQLQRTTSAGDVFGLLDHGVQWMTESPACIGHAVPLSKGAR